VKTDKGHCWSSLQSEAIEAQQDGPENHSTASVSGNAGGQWLVLKVGNLKIGVLGKYRKR
jgi:hypothetical protein